MGKVGHVREMGTWPPIPGNFWNPVHGTDMEEGSEWGQVWFERFYVDLSLKAQSYWPKFLSLLLVFPWIVFAIYFSPIKGNLLVQKKKKESILGHISTVYHIYGCNFLHHHGIHL